ncbi:hypothetical protein J5T34_23035 [Cupriavidus gilardii]|nr:hypothetical protein [Cupriavidus gilardii]MBO4123610.1 hypothetical protein [Cupriavidus gilardii]
MPIWSMRCASMATKSAGRSGAFSDVIVDFLMPRDAEIVKNACTPDTGNG